MFKAFGSILSNTKIKIKNWLVFVTAKVPVQRKWWPSASICTWLVRHQEVVVRAPRKDSSFLPCYMATSFTVPGPGLPCRRLVSQLRWSLVMLCLHAPPGACLLATPANLCSPSSIKPPSPPLSLCPPPSLSTVLSPGLGLIESLLAGTQGHPLFLSHRKW